MVEKALGVEGESTLYVGDHIYTVRAAAHPDASSLLQHQMQCLTVGVMERAPADTLGRVGAQDAALAKLRFRWRTALVVRELEEEVRALVSGREHRQKLKVGGHAVCLLAAAAAVSHASDSHCKERVDIHGHRNLTAPGVSTCLAV